MFLESLSSEDRAISFTCYGPHLVTARRGGMISSFLVVRWHTHLPQLPPPAGHIEETSQRSPGVSPKLFSENDEFWGC